MENFQSDFTKDADEGEKGSWRALIFTKYQAFYMCFVFIFIAALQLRFGYFQLCGGIGLKSCPKHINC